VSWALVFIGRIAVEFQQRVIEPFAFDHEALVLLPERL
jgi:hypothetical protein